MNGSFTSAAPPSGRFRGLDREPGDSRRRRARQARGASKVLLLALGLAGMACAQLFAAPPHIAHPPSQSAEEATPSEGAAPNAVAQLLPGSVSPEISTQAATSLAPTLAPSLGANAPQLDWTLAARSNPPGQTWQDAANAADWASVAQLIDELDEPARSEPGVRYARAVAARELGQFDVALRALEDLESSLPLLHEEIKTARAHCQLEVGPYETAYQYFTREQSPENLILASRACLNGKDLGRAQQTVDKAFQKIKKQGSESRRGRRNEIGARALRASIFEARGQPKVAARDWLWLATEAPSLQNGCRWCR